MGGRKQRHAVLGLGVVDVYKRQILNRLTGMFSEDRDDFIASFDEYDLLIIDALGVERSTEYAMEQMFFVIDRRYRSRRPMIITTNLKLTELKNPPDLAHARICLLYTSRSGSGWTAPCRWPSA